MKDYNLIKFPAKHCREEREKSAFSVVAERLLHDAEYLRKSDKTPQGVWDVADNMEALAEWLTRLT